MRQITKTLTQIVTGIAAAATLFAGRAMALTAQEGAEAAKADEMPSDLIGENGVFTNITSTLLLVVGIISVVMLIFGGIRYIISGGDQKKVTDAKNTILYALIGLVISLLAYAIVKFVIGAIGGTANV